MDCFSSPLHEYQPILAGAGCLALGYMYGRHCRSVVENQVGAPTMSDAACCAGTESFNYIPEPAAAMVDPETMAIVRQWLNPAEASWDFSDRELTEKRERCAKRDLEILPRKKEEMIWNQNVFKVTSSLNVHTQHVDRSQRIGTDMNLIVETKECTGCEEGSRSNQARVGSGAADKFLAQQLEFFTKSLSGTRASTNKKPTQANDDRHDVATSCEEAKNAQEMAINNPRKGAAGSLSGLSALASPQEDDGQGESSPGSSVEDTCTSPKPVCLGDGDGDGGGEDDEQDNVLERSCQVELTNPAPRAETVTLARVNCTLSNDPAFAQLVGDDMPVGLMESKDHTTVENEADESPNAGTQAGIQEWRVPMEVDAHKKVDPAMRLELPTSPPPELLHREQEGQGVGEGDAAAGTTVPAIDEGVLFKAEINKRLLELPQASAADSIEKKGNRASKACCCGATSKPVRFRWLRKLASSWRKRSKLWRRRCNARVALPAPAEASHGGSPEIVNSCGAPVL